MYPLIQRQMILWTLGLVVLVGGGVGYSVLQPPSSLARKAKKTQPTRVPASIPSLAAEVPNHILVDPGAHVSDFNVECDEAAESTFAETIQQVRLRGKTCSPSKKAKLTSTQIRNQTNGFIATVFTSDESKFTTDYINLKPGENHITIDMTFSDGSSLARKLRFSRKLTE